MTELDPFASLDDEENDEGNEQNQTPDNKSFQDLRKAFREAKKAHKTLLTEAEELRTFKAQVETEKRDGAITAAFTQVGLNPKHAALFTKVNPDVEVTPEIVQAFANEYELVTQTGETVDAPEVKAGGFTPVVAGASAPVQSLSTDDVKALLAKGDLETVAAAYKAGRVDKEVAPWRVAPQL